MLVKDVMTPAREVITIAQMSSVREALKRMKEHNVRALVVEKNGENGAYGLITYKNILQAIVAQEGDIDLLNIYDIATIPALSVSQNLKMRYAAKMMIQNSIKRLLVCDNNELYGILTMSDLIEVLMKENDI